MEEASLRRVLVARACEEADPEGVFLPFHVRAAAARDPSPAVDPAGGRDPWQTGDPGRLLVARAERLLERLGRERPGLAALGTGPRFDPPLVPLLLLAFGLGLAADALGRERSLNLLAFPLLGLLGWNLAVYGSGLAGRALGRDGRGARVGAAARAWASLRARLARSSADAEAGFLALALGRFTELWLEGAGALEGARWRARLHAGAAAFAAGVVAGLYLAGFAFAYQATWESTFLDAEHVRRLLALLLGPAAALLGQPLPDVAGIEALRSPKSAPAAPWIHLWALTAALFVVLPRTLLGLRQAARAAALRRGLALDLDSPYFARLLAPQRGEGRTVRLLPYSMEPSAGAATRLRELAHELFGNRAQVKIEPHVPYGAEPPAPPFGGALVVIFDLAQSPEQEVHGSYLEPLSRAAGEAEPLLVVLDAERYAGLADPERVAERRRSWRRVLGEHGLEAVSLEPERPADTVFDEARAALWPTREPASA